MYDYTSASQVNAFGFQAADGQVVLGWMRLRRRGFIAAATHMHVALAQLLLKAAKLHLATRACTTIVVSCGRAPEWPTKAARNAVVLFLYSVSRPRWATCAWNPRWNGEALDLPSADVITVDFFAVDLGQLDSKSMALASRCGFSFCDANACCRGSIETIR